MKIKTLHLPSTRCLLAFEACARLESFTAAARELNTSQSSVSRYIAELESTLGAVLFERVKQRVRLSEQGKYLYRRVGQGLDRIRDGMQVVARWDSSLPVVIGCTHAISHLLVMPVFPALQSEMSDFGMVRVSTAEYEVLDSVLDPQIDIQFAYDVSELKPDEYVLLIQEAVKPLCAPEFKQRHAKELSKDPSEWSGLPLLDISPPNRGWADWGDWFQVHGSRPDLHVDQEFDNYIYLLEACAAGNGLALGAKGMVESYLSNGRLVDAHGEYVDFDRGLYAVLTERGRTKAAARQCLDILRTLFAS